MAITEKKSMDRLSNHSDRLDRIDTAIVSFVAIAEEVKKQKATLYGNGEIGMDERMRNTDRDIKELSVKLHQFMSQQEQKSDAHRAERNQYRFLTYGAFLSLIANIVLIWLNR
jgi:hypothetical protein